MKRGDRDMKTAWIADHSNRVRLKIAAIIALHKYAGKDGVYSRLAILKSLK